MPRGVRAAAHPARDIERHELHRASEHGDRNRGTGALYHWRAGRTACEA